MSHFECRLNRRFWCSKKVVFPQAPPIFTMITKQSKCFHRVVTKWSQKEVFEQSPVVPKNSQVLLTSYFIDHASIVSIHIDTQKGKFRARILDSEFTENSKIFSRCSQIADLLRAGCSGKSGRQWRNQGAAASLTQLEGEEKSMIGVGTGMEC